MKKLVYTCITLALMITHAWAQPADEEDGTPGKNVNCGGVERWSVKVLTDPDVNTIDFNPIATTVNGMVNIVTPPPSTSMPRYAGIEDKTYQLVCQITIKKNEDDDDYHLVFSDGTNTFIGEIPNPVCTTAASSAYVDQYIAARNFIDSHIAHGNVNNVNIPDVEVTGVAFIDPAHGQTGKAPNNIEFHPILDIHFYSAAGLADERAGKLFSVSLFPNPAHTKVTVNVVSKTEALQNCSLQLFDAKADCIGTFDLPLSDARTISQSLDISSLPPGTYIYKIISKGSPVYDGKLLIR